MLSSELLNIKLSVPDNTEEPLIDDKAIFRSFCICTALFSDSELRFISSKISLPEFAIALLIAPPKLLLILVSRLKLLSDSAGTMFLPDGTTLALPLQATRTCSSFRF